MVGRHTAPVGGVGHAHARRYSVGAGIGAEVAVERPVLLHDHDDVADLVDAGQRRHLERDHGRDRGDVPGAGGEEHPPLGGPRLLEESGVGEVRLAVEAGPRHHEPPPPRALLEQDLLARAAGIDVAAQRVSVSGDGERRGADEGHGGAHQLGGHAALEAVHAREPATVGGDRIGAEHDLEPAGTVGDRPGGHGVLPGCPRALPQGHRLPARAAAGQPAAHGHSLAGLGGVRREADGQGALALGRGLRRERTAGLRG